MCNILFRVYNLSAVKVVDNAQNTTAMAMTVPCLDSLSLAGSKSGGLSVSIAE
jgi:hypothetical protein